MQALKPGINLAGRFRLEEWFDEGVFTEVWLSKQEEEYRLVKFYKFEKRIGRNRWSEIQEEIGWSHLSHLSHPHILSQMSMDLYKGMPYTVYPYKLYGSVRKQMGRMTEKGLAELIQQVASALACLHSQNPPLLHGSIHPDNFLVDYNNNYLLVDCVISQAMRDMLPAGHAGKTEKKAYLPPEFFDNSEEIGPASDIFSFGVSLYEVASSKLPFGEQGGKQLVQGELLPDEITGYSARFNQVLSLCLARKPNRRPDVHTLLRLAERFLEVGEWQSVSGFSFGVPEKILNTRKFPAISINNNLPVLWKPSEIHGDGNSQKPLSFSLMGIAGLILLTVLGIWSLYSLTPELQNTQNSSYVRSGSLPVDSLQEFVAVTRRLAEDITIIDSLGGSLTEMDRLYLDQVRTYLKNINQEISSTLKIVDADSLAVMGWKEGYEKDEWLKAELADLKKYRNHVALIRARIE